MSRRPSWCSTDLGTRWEIARNGHKPYACGVVLHPILDAMVALGEQRALTPDDISQHRGARASDRGADHRAWRSQDRAAIEIQRSTTPARSPISTAAAGIAQFTDARASAPDVVALRGKIEVTTDESFRKDQAQATLVTASGERIEAHIPHASGQVDNPMSDRAIENKFFANAAQAVGDERARQIAATAWKLDKLGDVRDLIGLCA